MSKLEALIVERKTGAEPFHKDGEPIGDTLKSFWAWSSSDLAGNTLRGILAEYLVASDLGCTSSFRQEWDAYDIESPEGIKVEVKSGAYLQSWAQEKLSSIQFGIKPTFGWDAKTNTVSKEKVRQADVYVFCLLKHKEKSTIDPLNVNQWKFYVISTSRLNDEVPQQESITLSSLLKLSPEEVSFGSIGGAIRRVLDC